MMRTLTLLLLVAGCRFESGPAQTAAPADTAAGEITMTRVGANDAAIVVPVHINGEGPFDLVLDTGATVTCVTPDLAERLSLPAQRGVQGFGAGVGGAGRVQLVRYDTLRVGAARAFDIAGCVIDLASLESIGTSVNGLLGLNFLQNFDVRLDFGRDVLTLTARE